MKKLFLLFFILLSIQAFSQLSVGLTGGFLLPVHKYKDSLATPNKASKMGIEALIGINEKWTLRTGIEYVNFTFSQVHIQTDSSGPFIDHQSATQYFHSGYINIPVGIRRYLPIPNTSFNLFIDGSVNLMGNINHRSTIENNQQNLVYPTYTPKSFIISPALGLGVQVRPTEKIYASFMANYTYQTTYMYEMPNNKSDMKQVRYNSINVLLSVGYTF